ncbi:MAG: 4Fe-4S binding protein [Desulfovibrio sp.]|jgi:formate hydrogenlyase subunit 6/NADH:ubiquinone oxidoreductase subunit I|nr:4Fe-4S binding protein [Desulfovibrio sp.]
MSSFLKVLFRNVLNGPSTDPFPLGETFTPDRLRGKVLIDPELCMGCGTCKEVCTAGAIDLSELADGSGFRITVWQNSCCLCASCRHYCPTGAASLIPDWHAAHPEEDKYVRIEQQTVKYEPCSNCGTLMRPIPAKLARKLYASSPELDPEQLRHLCPACRRLRDALKGRPFPVAAAKVPAEAQA